MRTRFEAVILGDGNHRATCEKLARRLGLQDRVTFKGMVRIDELPEVLAPVSVGLVLNRASAATHPSHR